MKDTLDKLKAVTSRVAALELLERPQKMEFVIASVRSTLGASAPTLANRAVGASGNVLLPVAQFSQTTQNDVYFIFHAPEELDSGTRIYPHIMWLPGASWSSGNYMLKLEYLVKAEDAAYATGTPTTLSFNVTPSTVANFIETQDSTGIAVSPENMVICHFYRDVANDNGNDTMDLVFFEFEYNIR